MALKQSPEILAFYGFIDAEEYLRRTDATEQKGKHPPVSQGAKDKTRNAQLLRWRKKKGIT
jgi:hypothetical protein